MSSSDGDVFDFEVCLGTRQIHLVFNAASRASQRSRMIRPSKCSLRNWNGGKDKRASSLLSVLVADKAREAKDAR